MLVTSAMLELGEDDEVGKEGEESRKSNHSQRFKLMSEAVLSIQIPQLLRNLNLRLAPGYESESVCSRKETPITDPNPLQFGLILL